MNKSDLSEETLKRRLDLFFLSSFLSILGETLRLIRFIPPRWKAYGQRWWLQGRAVVSEPESEEAGSPVSAALGTGTARVSKTAR